MKTIITIINVIAFFASISAPQEIVIAVDQGNPPFMFEKDGKAAGLYPTLLSAIFDRMGMSVDIKPYPWKRALLMGKNGEAGIGGIYKNLERLKIYDYSDVLYTERVLLYVKKGHEFEFNTLSDLEGKKIGVLLGWSYGDDVDQARKAGKLKVEEVSNDKANFQKLDIERMDGVFSLELTGNILINQKAYQGRIVALAKPVAENTTYLVFAKQSQKSELLDKFNMALNAMKDDGTYEQVAQTYLESAKK
jgi:polar amino acid transport system substrate-binding protein